MPLWDLKLPGGGGSLRRDPDDLRQMGRGNDRARRAGAPIAVCGVATECCVLSTVLGAIDAGRFVRLVTDACAAARLR